MNPVFKILKMNNVSYLRHKFTMIIHEHINNSAGPGISDIDKIAIFMYDYIIGFFFGNSNGKQMHNLSNHLKISIDFRKRDLNLFN